MLLHLLYVIAFTILAFLAVSNLIRNLMTLSVESQRHYAPRSWPMGKPQPTGTASLRLVPHPEFLDATGNVINEPLLVMRSMSVDDAREQLDAIYESSPGSNAAGSNELRDDG